MRIVCCRVCRQAVFGVEDGEYYSPLRGEMFKLLSERDYVMPRGPITKEVFCPECYGFPFVEDYGSGEILNRVFVRLEDGRLEEEELVEREKNYLDKGKKIIQTEKRDVGRVCIECGARSGRSGLVMFHRKNCSHWRT